MTTYKYTAISHNGTEMTGSVQAVDRYEAIGKIKQMNLVVDELREVGGISMDKLTGPAKVTDKALSLVCNQFAIILSAGLPLVRSVELIASQVTDKALKSILDMVKEDVRAGSTLAASFENRGPRLPTTFIETIRAGEQSGNLDNAFRRLSAYYNKQSKTKSKVASAMVYPAFVMCVAVVVVAVIMLYAMPTFASTFQNMGTELPWITKFMIGMSDFFRNNILFMIIFIAAFVMAFKLVGRTEKGKTLFSKAAIVLPVFGKIVTMSAATQFAGTMSTMLSSGLPINQAVGITGRAMSSHVIGLSVQQAVIGLESGKSMAECLAGNPYLPTLLIEMVKVGEETGSLENTLNVLSDYYDNEVETATSRAMSLLEPAIIVFLAFFVVMVLLSVYIPMFSMYDSV